MDYKRIIKSRSLRLKILECFSFVPDELMVKIQYRIKTGRKLHLKKPERFTEKLQWYKLYYRNPLMPSCVDKWEVREYVRRKGFGYILNESYGVYESVEEIDWGRLPRQFVLKDTLGGGGNSVILCNDLNSFDRENAKKQVQEWLDIGVRKIDPGREWVYCNQKHRVIMEKYIPSGFAGGLVDYKFFCFDGRAEYLYVIADRRVGEKAGFGIFDRSYRQLDVIRADEKPLERRVEKPDNFEEMMEIAEHLAEGFPEVRVDFYDEEGKIIFGEMTFFDGSGYMRFRPDEFDFVLGKAFDLSRIRGIKNE